MAVRSGHVEVVQELVKAGAAKDIKQEDGLGLRRRIQWVPLLRIV